MCLTCGCHDAHQKVGNNLPFENVRDVAAENGKMVDETICIMAAAAERDRTQHADEYGRAWGSGPR